MASEVITSVTVTPIPSSYRKELGKNAYIDKVILNGKVIQENVELPKPTPGGLTGKEKAEGPIMFQGDHGPVAYRNIKITPLK